MTGFVEVSQNEMMVVDGGGEPDWMNEGVPVDPWTIIAVATAIATVTYTAGYSAGKWFAGLFN